MPAYRAYSSFGTAPAAPNPIRPANPVHEVPDSFRPDFMPLQDTRGAYADPSMAQIADDYGPGPGWPFPAPSAYEDASAEFGTVGRNRDTQEGADRPVNVNPYDAHFTDEFGRRDQPDLILNNSDTAYYYDDLDVPGGFTVERRGSPIETSESAYLGGKNWNPGANSLPSNNVTYDRWRHDDLVPTDDFGEPLKPGTDVVVTVERPMQQPYGGNLVEGLKMYPHPLGDNILQAPMAPSQFPDRPMEIPDPYLPGGGIYRDTARKVYLDPATDATTQAFAEQLPADAPSYAGSWE